MRSTLNLDPVLQMQISNSFWCICKLLMQNGLENVFFTVCVVAFACVGAMHLSIRIFANTLWMISLGVCGGLCLLWWGPFLHCIPHGICKLCWEMEIVGVFYVWWFSGCVPLKDFHNNAHF